MDTVKSAITSADVEGTLSRIAMHFPRVHYRFGKNSTSAIEDVARRVSSFLIPPQVRERILSNEVKRMQILIESNDPPLPWELAHDGEGFLGLKIPIINTPVSLAGKRSSCFDPRGVIIVEGMPDTYGIELSRFLARHLANIRVGNMSIGRVQAKSVKDLMKIIRQGSYDIIHYAGHTITGPYMHFLLGDDRVSVKDFSRAMGKAKGEKLIILDSCETASCFPYNKPSYKNNPAYLLAEDGFHVVGTVGWLEMTTSDHFNQWFYDSLTNCMNIELAMLKAKRMLVNEQKDWWVFSHFGIVTDGYLSDNSA